MANLNQAYDLQFQDNRSFCTRFSTGLQNCIKYIFCCKTKRHKTFEELNEERNREVLRNVDTTTRYKLERGKEDFICQIQ